MFTSTIIIPVLSFVVPVVAAGAVGYVHLWIKASVTEADQKSLYNLIEVRFADLDKRLERIERSMNGFLLKEGH